MAIRSEFEKQLDEVETLIARLGEKCVADVRAAALATQGDRGAAEGILQGGKASRRLRDRVETECLDIMLLQQPLIGPDMRLVTGSFRLVSDLYQIDSMARDIAGVSQDLPKKALRKMDAIYQRMAEHAAEMTRMALEAFEHSDAEAARGVFESDETLDELYDRAEDEVVELIRAATKGSAKTLPELLMVAKYFERIGDQAQRIAAWAVFRETGERMISKNGEAVIDPKEEAVG